MKLFSIASLIVLSLVLTGCLSVDTVVKLNRDGSGTVTQTTMINSVMMGQMQGMLSGMAQQMGAKETNQSPLPMPEFFTEKEASARAAKMGVGVSFVSSRKLKTDKTEGMEAIYAFKDITKLKISENPATPGPQGLNMTTGDSEGETTFRLERLTDGHSLLTILPPAGKMSQSKTKDSPPLATGKPTSPPDAEQMEMAKKLFEGMRFSLVIDVQGKLVKTNCPYVDGSRVTLLEMDFAQLLDNEAMLRNFSGVRPQTLDEAKELLKQVKGFKISLEPETKIEFE
jgi:hypothetical protein